MKIVSLTPAGDEIARALDLPLLAGADVADAQPDIVIAGADGVHSSSTARVITLHPSTLEGIFQSITQVGEATDKMREANALVQSLRERIERVRASMNAAVHRPTVAALEWLNPPSACGRWMPEMIEIAGGRCVLGETGQPARQIEWDDVIASQAEMVVVMPNEKDIAGSVQAFIDVADLPVWRDLPATYLWQLYAVDALAYFSRPGPRIVDGIEILAGMIQPHLWPAPGPEQALRVNDVLQTPMRIDRNRRLRLE